MSLMVALLVVFEPPKQHLCVTLHLLLSHLHNSMYVYKYAYFSFISSVKYKEKLSKCSTEYILSYLEFCVPLE